MGKVSSVASCNITFIIAFEDELIVIIVKFQFNFNIAKNSLTRKMIDFFVKFFFIIKVVIDY